MKQILGLTFACVFVAACSGGSQTDATADSGGTSTGGASGAAGAGGTALICTSKSYWTGGDKGSELMHPGGACLTCHAINRDAPRFSVAGTVYPTSHEPDDCNGVNGSSLGVSVVITDANGKQLAPIPVNAAGNFHYEGNIAAPFHVKVVSHGKENAMSASPENGQCNSCHTQNGANGAPGRILSP